VSDLAAEVDAHRLVAQIAGGEEAEDEHELHALARNARRTPHARSKCQRSRRDENTTRVSARCINDLSAKLQADSTFKAGGTDDVITPRTKKKPPETCRPEGVR
jgi:hypothetical protein